MLEENCSSFAAMFFVPPLPTVTLTILSEMFYISKARTLIQEENFR